MSNAKQLSGHCLCGAVTLVANTATSKMSACHCGSCRRWGGGPFMEVECGSDVEFTGDENISIYDSSKWAERGFCNKCGTHLFYRLKASQQHMVPVGLLDGDPDRKFVRQVFIDEKPDDYKFADETENLTGAELFAMYAPPE